MNFLSKEPNPDPAIFFFLLLVLFHAILIVMKRGFMFFWLGLKGKGPDPVFRFRNQFNGSGSSFEGPDPVFRVRIQFTGSGSSL